MQGDGDQRLTGSVGEFILLAFDPVLEAFRIASCSSNFVLHLLVGHFRRHVSRLAVGGRRKRRARVAGWAGPSQLGRRCQRATRWRGCAARGSGRPGAQRRLVPEGSSGMGQQQSRDGDGVVVDQFALRLVVGGQSMVRSRWFYVRFCRSSSSSRQIGNGGS